MHLRRSITDTAWLINALNVGLPGPDRDYFGLMSATCFGVNSATCFGAKGATHFGAKGATISEQRVPLFELL